MKSDNKWPFIQWFITDWLADPKVSQCEPATRGILFDWICNMHALDRSGQVTGTRELLARLGRCTVPQAAAALQDLANTNAADVQERNGVVTVVNRRMKREHLARKSTLERVQKHRSNAPVTPHNHNHNQFHNQNHIQEPEPEPEDTHRQYSQSLPKPPKLTKLTMEQSSVGRIARDILSNKHSWSYDNCKVQPEMFPFQKSLVTVLAPFAGKIHEHKAHAAWQEAVTRTHQAVVDHLANDPARYAIQCWKEALEHEAEKFAIKRL